MRDDEFLKQRLDAMWEFLFPDVKKANIVVIRFKGKWRNKFGHIKRLNNGDSEIVINSHFKNEKIPEYIIDTTIAHELVHYMHGFNSPLPRMHKHPHKGGIVNKELKKRGFGNMISLERKWVRNEWRNIVKEEYKQPVKQEKSRFFKWF
ncbi:MAG: hypothetical protein AABW52_03150 [Nanoarchaeota archaeon]